MLDRKQVVSFVAATLLGAAIVSVPLPAQAPKAQLQHSPVAPRAELVKATVNEAYDKFKNEKGGKNADYIPVLAKVDSKLFGIAVATADNQVYSVGDVNYSFSIQSISKVFSLALAMEELGALRVGDRAVLRGDG